MGKSIAIDTQNYFTLPVATAVIEGTVEAVPQMHRLVEGFRAANVPTVHGVRWERADGSNVDRCWWAMVESGAEIVSLGTDGAEMVAELKPSSDMRLDPDRLLGSEVQSVGPQERGKHKPRWIAIYPTGLEDHLATWAVDTSLSVGGNF